MIGQVVRAPDSIPRGGGPPRFAGAGGPMGPVTATAREGRGQGAACVMLSRGRAGGFATPRAGGTQVWPGPSAWLLTARRAAVRFAPRIALFLLRHWDRGLLSTRPSSAQPNPPP
jgi:hypothetical protein